MAAQWVVTGNYLVVTVSGMRPVIIEKSTANFERIMSLLVGNVPDEQLVVEIDMIEKIKACAKQAGVEGDFCIDKDSGIVAIDGIVVHDAIVDRIVEFARCNLPYLPLLNFWRNVQLNPSEESKQHLFLFLEANKMQITHDGCFVAYKGVEKNQNGDFVDSHTRTFCNNVGAVVVMEREKVNPHRLTTCSSGLHVAAWDYVKGTYQTIIEVKVNPRDVVAVPNDYNNQKMRVCRYEVVAINPGKPKDVVSKPLIEKIEEDEMRKEGIGKQKKEKQAKLLENLKETEIGACVDLTGLTAGEVVEVTVALCAFCETIDTTNLANIDKKNKKSIVKKASALLIQAGYTVK